MGRKNNRRPIKSSYRGSNIKQLKLRKEAQKRAKYKVKFAHYNYLRLPQSRQRGA